MKRQISISLFLALLVIVLLMVYLNNYNNMKKEPQKGVLTKTNQSTTEESISISQEYQNYKYYIKNEDGRLVVYNAANQSIYSQTGILTESLPHDLIEELQTGIFFSTEADLYNFLESYSS